ncbi:unnamed protein product [Cylicostephanus goldi]|uniref:Uncharacterized protein n=1 Tax=Cylicostephanus goldi TaxID=71465 RepID=A0A3P6TC43_CYLGO|nr:unnamed protein product [Cylicostephanus goldi]
MVQRSKWKLLPSLASVLVTVTIMGNIRNAWVDLEGESCDTITKLFPFFPTLSAEEGDFPIAYAMLVHKDVTQVFFFLVID